MYASLVVSDPLFTTRRNQIIALAARIECPRFIGCEDFADAGGFVSYGASIADAYCQIGAYTARILKGIESVRSAFRAAKREPLAHETQMSGFPG